VATEAVRPDARRLGPGVRQPGRRHGADRGGREGAVGSGATTDRKLSQARALVRTRRRTSTSCAPDAGRTTSSTPQDRPVGFEQVTAAFRTAGCRAVRRNRRSSPRRRRIAHPVPCARDAVGQGVLPGDGAPVPARPAREGCRDRVREVPLPREAQDAHRDEVRVHEVPPREQGHRLRALPQGAAGLYEGR